MTYKIVMTCIAIYSKSSVKYSVFFMIRMKPKTAMCRISSIRKMLFMMRAKIIHIRLYSRNNTLLIMYSRKINWVIDRMLKDIIVMRNWLD